MQSRPATLLVLVVLLAVGSSWGLPQPVSTTTESDLPDPPTLDNLVHLVENNEALHPAMPPLRTTSDGRIGFDFKEHIFYLIEPKKLSGTPFVDSMDGVGLIGDTEGHPVDPTALYDDNVVSGNVDLRHAALCEPPSEVVQAGCDPDDCYNVSVITPVQYTATAQQWIHLFKTDFTITVSNPKSDSAAIASIESGTPTAAAAPIPSRNMNETMITDDGRLLVARFGGNHREMPGVDIGYSYSPSPCDIDGWTEFYSVTYAHYDLGGSGGKPLYEFARYPLRDPSGYVINPDSENPYVDLGGSYPWIDRKGRNLFFTTVSTTLFYLDANQMWEARYPAECVPGTSCEFDKPGSQLAPEEVDEHSTTRGVAVAGLWTRGKTVLLDGLINNIDYGLRMPGESHRQIDLYEGTKTRIGTGRNNVDLRDFFGSLNVPPGFVSNSTFIDSPEHLLNAHVETRPTTPRDVVWLINTGHASTEVAFDDYLDPAVFIYSDMTGSMEWVPDTSGTNGRFDYFDGFERGTDWVGFGFNGQQPVRVQNASTSMSFPIEPPRYGEAIGTVRLEPIAQGGIRGKGFWLDGDSVLEYSVEHDISLAKEDWYIGLFIDPAFDGSQGTLVERRLLTMSDSTTVSLVDLDQVKIKLDSTVIDFLLPTPLADAWSHIGLQVSNEGKTVTLFINGEEVDDSEVAIPILQIAPDAHFLVPPDLKVEVGGLASPDSSFRGWIDEFKVIRGVLNEELYCNHALGTVVSPSGDLSSLECHRDYGTQEGGHLGNIPAGKVSRRDFYLFPEGPLAFDSVRPSTLGNQFCQSCHADYSPGIPAPLSLQSMALTATSDLLQDDPRRQPLMPPALIRGHVPQDLYGSGLPGVSLTCEPEPCEQDEWVFPPISNTGPSNGQGMAP